MRYKLVLVILVGLTITFCKEYQIITNKFICQTPNTTLVENFTCALYRNRTNQYISASAYIVSPIDNVWMDIQFYYKYNVYRKTFISGSESVCNFLDGVTSKFLNYTAQSLFEHTNVFHKCPFQGHIYITNYSLDSIPIIVTEGDYRIDLMIRRINPNVNLLGSQYFVTIKRRKRS